MVCDCELFVHISLNGSALSERLKEDEKEANLTTSPLHRAQSKGYCHLYIRSVVFSEQNYI